MKTEQTLQQAFANAMAGLGHFVTHDRNGKLQLLIAVFAVIAAFFFSISLHEWIAVLLCIGGVLSLEMLNSAIEKLCDLVHEAYHPVIKIVKDVAAAAVLMFSFVSVAIGAIIFIPRIIQLF